MTAILDWLSYSRVLDATGEPSADPILAPFARDELLCRSVGAGHAPVIHLWRHPRAFVLGLRDRRLPNAEEAMAWLATQGYDVAVRNSGGAAVPLDAGVVNVSAVLPIGPLRRDFRADFAIMAELIRQSMRHRSQTVEHGEIAGAYCPGDYDLSIGGRKFCGISQRRQMKSFVLHAFVVVSGSGEERARLVRRFYEIAAGQERPHERESLELGAAPRHPLVRASSMGSLDELVGGYAADDFIGDLRRLLHERGATQMEADELPFAAAEQEAMQRELLRRYGQ